MYYTIYQITNTINGKIYIGKHQTEDLNDDYMGSGKLIRLAIDKYGIEGFEKQILHIFDCEFDMNEKESEIVTEDFCNDMTTYNLCVGGKGGWSHVNRNGLNTSGVVNRDYKRIHEKAVKTRKSKKLKVSENTRLKMSENNWAKRNPEKHKKHISSLHKGKKRPKTEEHRLKISKALSGTKHDTVECPHCGKIGGRVMKRWHFDKCKARI